MIPVYESLVLTENGQTRVMPFSSWKDAVEEAADIAETLMEMDRQEAREILVCGGRLERNNVRLELEYACG